MSEIINKAILVTSWDLDTLAKAHAEVPSTLIVSPIISQPLNGRATFTVLGSGSKAGWPEAIQDDLQLTMYIEWLRAQAYDDGSNVLDYTQVTYA